MQYYHHLLLTTHLFSAHNIDMCQSLVWCFTINNYVEDELVTLRTGLSKEARYAVFGYETGDEGTPHLQGYVSFKTRKRLAGVKKILGNRAHVEASKGTELQNFEYCTKQGKFEEFGKRTSSGKRCDLDEFKEAVKSGMMNPVELRENHSEVAARYPRFFDAYRLDNLPAPAITCHPLYKWQLDLSEELKHPPNDRTIYFIVDYEGNQGKTWFATYYQSLHPKTYILEPGKKVDMAYQLPDELRVVFIDCTREQNDILQYSFLESLKNGRVTSAKYESRIKLYGRMHVVVLMNQDPDLNKLSKDRYVVIHLK